MREGKKIEAWLFEMGRDKRREKNERERERERNKHPNRQMTITHLIINSISKPDVINLLLCQTQPPVLRQELPLTLS